MGYSTDLTDKVNLVLTEIEARREHQNRLLVAITGAPASGKSTLSAELLRRLGLKKISAVVVPMDGFHLDNSILDEMGMRARKGSPETFDSDGFIQMIRRIRDRRPVYYPEFDRTRDIAIAGKGLVPADCEVIIVEGNYLMFDETPWRELAPLWDLTIRWEIALPQLRARLIQRWLSLNHSRTNAIRKVEGNDIPNAERVINAALPCDISLKANGTD